MAGMPVVTNSARMIAVVNLRETLLQDCGTIALLLAVIVDRNG